MAGPPRPPDVTDVANQLPVYGGDPEFGAGVIKQRLANAPAPPPYPGYMSPQDLAALAFKTIADAYAPQVQYLQAQARRQQQMHQAQQAGLVELYKILAGSYSGLGGQISGDYENAAAGLSLPSDAVTNDLGVSQDIVRSGAAQGPGYGSAYPQLAGQQGQVEFLRAVQQANADEQTAQDQIARLIAEEPEKVQALLSQLSGQQADLAKAGQPIIRSAGGSIVAIDPTTGKVQVLYQGAGGAGGPPKTFRGPGGSVYTWAQDKKGNWVPQLIAAGSDPSAKPPSTVKGPNGRVDAWVQNEDGSWKLVPVRSGTGPKPTKPTYWTDDAGNRHMTTGDGVDVIIVPASPKTAKPPSNAVIRAGWKSITDSYYHAPGSSKRLTDADIQKKLATINASRQAFNAANHLSPGDPKYRAPITPDLLPRMTSAQLRVLGIAGQERNPQDVYIDLVHSGIPARRAWGMVRKYYPEWGKGYFSGKADAAATGGTPTSYSGVPQQQVSLAQKYGAQYGVDPRLLLAIAGHETHWGTLGAGRQGYTLGYGATDSGLISRYRGVTNQYRWAAQTLAKWGVHTLADLLAGKAASYATDPNWEAGVARVYESLDGGTV